MKTTKFRILFLAIFTIIFNNIFAQENDDDLLVDQIVGVFEGYNEEMDLYNFSVNYTEDGVDMTDEYQFIIKDEKLRKKFELKSKELIGQQFLIKFKVEVVSKYNEKEDFEDIVEQYIVLEIDIFKE